MITFVLSFLEDLVYLSPRFMRKGERPRNGRGPSRRKRPGGVSRHAYLVILQTDDGKRKMLRPDKIEDFDLYEEGRKYTRKAGHDLPDRKPAP